MSTLLMTHYGKTTRHSLPLSQHLGVIFNSHLTLKKGGVIREETTMTDSNTAGTITRLEEGRQAIKGAYETAQEYAQKSADVIGDVSSDLADFVRKEPWIAMVAAFAVGYVAARLMRRVTP
jgi:ElaB/YqjD/DUF883 family membrane-anchored ribosome-binding protein